MSARMSFFILMVASFRFSSLFLSFLTPPSSSSSSIHFFALVLSLPSLSSLYSSSVRRRDPSILHSFYPQPHPTELKARLFRVPLLIPLSLLPSPYPLLPVHGQSSSDLFLSCFSWFNSFLLSRRECLNSLRPLFTPCLSPPLSSPLLFSSRVASSSPRSKPRKVGVELSLSLCLTLLKSKAVKFDS